MKRLFPLMALLLIIILALFALAGTTADPDEPIISITRNDVTRVADDAVEASETIAMTTGAQIESFLERLLQSPSSQIARVLFIVAGVILLVFGWRIYNFIIILAGAWVGASLASALIISNNVLIEIISIVIGGFLGAILAMFLYFIAVFIIGMYVGAILTIALASLLSLTPVSPIVLFAGAIIGGAFVLALSAELVIFVSALVGAQMLTAGLGLNREWMLLFSIIGMGIQIAATRFYSIDLRRRPQRAWIRR